MEDFEFEISPLSHSEDKMPSSSDVPTITKASARFVTLEIGNVLDDPVNRIFVPPTSPAPRSKTPLAAQNTASNVNNITPTKPKEDADPWTPTANIKLLLSAASPEIRKMEILKQNQMSGSGIDTPAAHFERPPDTVGPDGDAAAQTTSNKKIEKNSRNDGAGRKEKSLGLLCDRY